jgi:hypothetical protein
VLAANTTAAANAEVTPAATTPGPSSTPTVRGCCCLCCFLPRACSRLCKRVSETPVRPAAAPVFGFAAARFGFDATCLRSAPPAPSSPASSSPATNRASVLYYSANPQQRNTTNWNEPAEEAEDDSSAAGMLRVRPSASSVWHTMSRRTTLPSRGSSPATAASNHNVAMFSDRGTHMHAHRQTAHIEAQAQGRTQDEASHITQHSPSKALSSQSVTFVVGDARAELHRALDERARLAQAQAVRGQPQNALVADACNGENRRPPEKSSV